MFSVILLGLVFEEQTCSLLLCTLCFKVQQVDTLAPAPLTIIRVFKALMMKTVMHPHKLREQLLPGSFHQRPPSLPIPHLDLAQGEAVDEAVLLNLVNLCDDQTFLGWLQLPVQPAKVRFHEKEGCNLDLNGSGACYVLGE